MDDKLSDIESKITKLNETTTLSKRLKLSSKIKKTIDETEKDLNKNLEKLNDVYELNSISDESLDISEQDVKDITDRIEQTKIKIDKETDINKRIALYTNLKLDIEQCKAYYSQVKMTVKNLN